MSESLIVNMQRRQESDTDFLGWQRWQLFCCTQKQERGEDGRVGSGLRKKQGKFFTIKSSFQIYPIIFTGARKWFLVSLLPRGCIWTSGINTSTRTDCHYQIIPNKGNSNILIRSQSYIPVYNSNHRDTAIFAICFKYIADAGKRRNVCYFCSSGQVAILRKSNVRMNKNFR